MTGGEQLLAEYIGTGSEAAFHQLVEGYVNLVYSVALRLVNGDAHLAEDVTQTVFVDLARMARKLGRGVMLGGWLHRHTCFVALNTMRGERRRQFRERQAVEMNSMEDHSEGNLAAVAPVLDQAINQLGSEDRAAIVLRFYEQKDFRAVGEAMGSSEEAARKRVDRALEKLHSTLSRKGVALSATALAATLTTQAVTAAPAGLALTVSTAVLAAAAAGTGTTLTILNIMSMTKLKITVAAALVAALAVPLAMELQSNSNLRAQNESLQKQLGQITQLSAENQRLSDLLAKASAATVAAPTNGANREVLKLRGEVGRLKAAVSGPKPSPLSSVISDPETRKIIRDQQKMGMGMIYNEFATKAKLEKDQKDKFVNLLADDIMENVDHVGETLREGKSVQEIDQIFTQQEASLQAKMKELLGPEAFTDYQDYTHNLLGRLTADQFKGEITGDKDQKDDKLKQLYETLRGETQAVLREMGLPPDFQTVPILNFRNMASETEAEKNLKMLDDIYDRTAARATSFLSADELKKFTEFRAKAIQNSKAALAVNRKMMAPGNK
jgi:RNA polymerase sigma factor (sigma-70 family)